MNVFVCLAALLPLSIVLSAQSTEPGRPRMVRASGEATVSAKPDRAEVTIGVATRAPTAAAASAQNAEETTRVLASLRQALGNGGQVKTSGYALSPQYEYQNGHPPRLTGYEASNTVTVTVDELNLLGKIIDSATATGATNVNGIAFTLKDDMAVRQQALTEAAKRARANAEALAKALGVEVVGLLEAEPGDMPVVRPRPLMMATRAMNAQATPTPVEPGDLDIRATVTVTLQVR